MALLALIHAYAVTPDDFAVSAFRSVDDIRWVFEEQVFCGCERDDPFTAVASGRLGGARGVRVNARLRL